MKDVYVHPSEGEDFPRGSKITRNGLGWTERDVVYFDTPAQKRINKLKIIWYCIIKGKHKMKERRTVFNASRCERCGYTPE